MESLLEHISEGMQPSERHDAMEEVKGLLRSQHAAVEAFSAMGVPVMCSVIREDQDDHELVQVLSQFLGQHPFLALSLPHIFGRRLTVLSKPCWLQRLCASNGLYLAWEPF
jgi:hypothetical protein